MRRPSAWTSPLATDAELWLRRFVILQGFLPAPLLMLGVAAHLVLRGAGAALPTPAVVAVLAGLTLTELGVIVLAWRARRRARALLVTSRFMICPACRYSLAASPPAGTCPECGRSYEARALRRLWQSAYWSGLEPPRLPGDEAVSDAL